MTSAAELVRAVAAASGERRFPEFKLTASTPRTDYAPAAHVEQYRRLAVACDAGDCQYAVVEGAKPRPSAHGRCDGVRGAVHIEHGRPVLRMRDCDRLRRWKQARTDASGS